MRLNKIIIVSILCLIGGLTNLSAQSSTKIGFLFQIQGEILINNIP